MFQHHEDRLLRIHNNKRTVYTCIIAYFRNSVKKIINIFYSQPIAVGKRAELAVAAVVGVGRKGVVDSHGASEGIVGKGTGGAVGGNTRQPLGDAELFAY